MFMLKAVLPVATLLALTACDQAQTRTAKKIETPRLGEEISHAELTAWDITIAPDGKGLPPGGGTAKQGEDIYTAKCASCHGFEGAGTPADRLAGGQGSLVTDKPIKTVGSYWPYATTLFDFIRRAMPLNEPASLSNDEVYAVSAYILHLNQLWGEDEVLNAANLAKIEMPNKTAFVQIWPGNLK